MKKQAKEDIHLKYLNKKVKLITTRNTFIVGKLVDWNDVVIIEKKMSDEPLAFKDFPIPKYMIKEIEIIENETGKKTGNN